MVRRLVERGGGLVVADRGPLGGARFTVRLPEALHLTAPAAACPLTTPVPAAPLVEAP